MADHHNRYNNEEKVWNTTGVKMTQRHEVSKCCCKNGTKRCGQRRVATSLQFAKRKNKHRICKVLQNELRPYLPFWRLHRMISKIISCILYMSNIARLYHLYVPYLTHIWIPLCSIHMQQMTLPLELIIYSPELRFVSTSI